MEVSGEQVLTESQQRGDPDHVDRASINRSRQHNLHAAGNHKRGGEDEQRTRDFFRHEQEDTGQPGRERENQQD